MNNYIGSDRKLIINDTNEFWVHDSLLTKNSKFFYQLFTNKIKATKEEDVKMNETTIHKTFIDVPHPEYFFDILIWIYTRDNQRLSLAVDEPENFLCILSLGIYLEMCDDFFTGILQNCDIQLDEKLYESNLWSRFCFTFEVLQKLIDLISKDDHFLHLLALLSWLKEDNTLKIINTEETINEREEELLTCKEFFLIKNYIIGKNYMSKITINQLYIIRDKYPLLIPVLDTNYLIEKFILKGNMKISCRVCKKSSNSIHEFALKPCEIKMYHPKSFVLLQRQINYECEHDDCKKKMNINEYPCCHKAAHVEGCLLSDGNHILQLQ